MRDTGNTFDNEAFDEKIFKKYQHAKVSVLSSIRPDLYCLTKGKEIFLRGEIPHPIFTYTKNNRNNYDKPEGLLHELHKDLAHDDELPQVIKEQYHLAIEERLSKIKLLRQTQALGRDVNPEMSMRLFLEYSKQLYGTVDADIFLKVMQTAEREINRMIAKPNFNNEHTPSVERLKALFSFYKKSHPHFVSLEVTPRIVVSRTPAVTDAGLLKNIFEEGFKEYGIDDSWSVVVDSKGARSTVSVSYNLQKIYLPSSEQLIKRSKRKRLTEARVRGLIAHEIGTHVVRKIRGERSVLKLLGVGLHQYEQGEEGLATYREQQAQSLQGYSGLEAYLAIGLALGSDGAHPRNFSQTHALMTDYFLITENTSIEHAKELAWNRCVRIFRGTSGMVPGVVFTKDLIYRKGNMRHWEAVKNNTLPDITIDAGKFDPTNEQHVHFLQSIGIT
ncbi:MAG: tyrosine/phenylalanine carboxypeptidase domain-containing protein [Patescibacteria group bacterium]